MMHMANEKNPLFGKLKFYKGFMKCQCAHGPKWTWYRWIGFRISHLSTILPTTARRLWIYTRWFSLNFDIVVDRRKMVPLEENCKES